MLGGSPINSALIALHQASMLAQVCRCKIIFEGTITIMMIVLWAVEAGAHPRRAGRRD